MDLSTVAGVLNARVDELCSGSYFRDCCMLSEHKQMQQIIQACGHDTSELLRAIEEAEKAVHALRMVCDKVVFKFKTDGVSFVVDNNKQGGIN